jgi:hypothetical protein
MRRLAGYGQPIRRTNVLLPPKSRLGETENSPPHDYPIALTSKPVFSRKWDWATYLEKRPGKTVAIISRIDSPDTTIVVNQATML